jgi:hypothetical protein
MKKNDLWLIGGFTALMIVVNVILVFTNRLSWTPAPGGWIDWTTFGTMVGAAITIAIMSQLYKDNPLFKLAEHMFVGSALGYGLVVAWYSMWVNEIIPGLEPIVTVGWRALIHPIQVAEEAGKTQLIGVWSVILPGILGLLMYTRLNRKTAWISRIPFAVMIGFGVGMAIPAEITANLLNQLRPMMVDMFHNAKGDFHVQRDILVIFIGVLCTLFYFFFSLEHKGPAKVVSKTGIYFLMVAFGASFGYTVMGRLSLLIGRINYLFRDWIPLIP